ncbi:hypothetical protein D9756_003683 [Leucocoprinus leucothites]|uniref:Oxysterol-binding protein n=1 Tax=Leucocoprinus leucothites TaxID=201217 RepID=A0A8H5D910_9AGAR|nr:hypothetical protein D9756_008132 [Leucoagaricus leucothites]KAF5355819.1 hypothetical protein D9756_003683 [Leucoagaricus leucothites]
MTETAGEAVPVAQRGSWTSFLKSIASFSGDLSSLTAPPFILSPTSLTEFPAYWCERPELFAAIADAKDNEARALAVLRWFISTLKDQYTSRNDSMGSEKKPLNPVLGELFYGYWPDINNRGRTTLLVEQVSHHPPITAYVIENKSKGLKLVGHNAQKTSFSSGSIIVRQIGHAILTVSGTEYLITLPRLRIDGLWYGSPYIELTDTSYIVGGGFLSTIEYKGKGYFSGKSHQFKATVVPLPGMGGSATKEQVVEGLWHDKSKYTKGPHASSSATESFHDVASRQKEVVTVVGGEPDGSQGDFETRKLWNLVAKGIREGDYEVASKEKSRIENDQRQMRKDEAAEERKWELKHFKRQESDPLYEKLGKMAKISPPEEDYYEFLANWPQSLVSN